MKSLVFMQYDYCGSKPPRDTSNLSPNLSHILNKHMQYICNIYAERLKAGDTEISDRMRFILEVVIPGISLCCLLVVTGYVTASAVDVIRRPTEDHEVVNIFFLFGFSSINVLVDLLSSCLFFRNGEEDVFLSYRIKKRISSYNSLSESIEEAETDGSGKANLNMISAFTHLTGDSMRTLSVIIAALISLIAKIPSNICDAWAAIVVTITICFMALPLLRELLKATTK